MSDDELKDGGCVRCGTEACLLPDPTVEVVEPKAPNPYEAKVAARVERLRARAAQREAEAAARFASVHSTLDAMAGTPVLIGHHSERRHRRALERVDANMGKACAAVRDATELARRADAAETSTAVSSDDPEAITKLRAKLAEEERRLAALNAANKLLRAGKTAEGLALLDWEPNAARTWAIWQSMAHTSWPTTNVAAECRRLRQRIEHLERVAATPAKPAETFGDVRVEEADNRVRIFFPGKPSDDVRSTLKRAGFRWSPTVGAWQAYPTYYARETATKVAASVVAP